MVAPIERVDTGGRCCRASRAGICLERGSERFAPSPTRSVAQNGRLRHVVLGEQIVQGFGQQVVDLFAVVARVRLQLRQRAPHGAREVRADQYGFFDLDRSTLSCLGRFLALPARSGQLAELGRAFLQRVRHVLYSYGRLIIY